MEWHLPSLMASLITGTFALLAIRDLANGRRDIILIVYPVHFLLCGIPPVLDWVLGKPDYFRFPGLVEATDHLPTHLVYCLYISVCPILWWLWNRRRNTRSLGELMVASAPRPRRLLLVTMSLVVATPFLLLFFAPDPTVYLSYTPYQRGIHHAYDAQRFHMLISRTTVFAVLAALIALYNSTHWKRSVITILPIIAALCWLHGKRNIVALAIAMIVFVIWHRRLLKGTPLIIWAALLFGLFATYSHTYQTHWRFSDAYYDARDWTDWYQNARIDYGRDDVIKMAILGEFKPSTYRVLDTRGQSIAIVLTVWIPRYLWPEKPVKYPSYITELAMGSPSPGGGALTTSWLDEAMANFSWLAFFVAPWWIHILARTGNNCRSFPISLMTMLILVFIQSVHFAPWAPIFYIWVLVVGYNRLKRLSVGPRTPKVNATATTPTHKGTYSE
jgi:hypothetical protein